MTIQVLIPVALVLPLAQMSGIALFGMPHFCKWFVENDRL